MKTGETKGNNGCASRLFVLNCARLKLQSKHPTGDLR